MSDITQPIHLPAPVSVRIEINPNTYAAFEKAARQQKISVAEYMVDAAWKLLRFSDLESRIKR